MKTILFAAIFAIAGFAEGMSQVPTAILQDAGNTSFFYGYDSLVEAYDSASKGAVITLSTGNFAPIDTISKSISIVGQYAFSSNEDMTAVSNIVVSADNVSLSGLRITGTLKMDMTTNLILKECYIENLTSDTNHSHTLLEDCAIRNDFSLPSGREECYRRCDVDRYHWGNSSANAAVFEYCTVRNLPVEQINERYSHGLRYYDNQLAMYGILRNCILHWCQMVQGQGLGQAPIYFNPQSNYVDILLIGGLYGTVDYVIPDGTSATYTADKFLDAGAMDEVVKVFPSFYSDEIVIPMEGGWEYKAAVGCSNHKDYPDLPRVISSNISRETDSDGKITVAVKISTVE